MSIIVTNVNTNETSEYISIYAASKDLGISRPTLKKYLDSGKCLENTYILRSNLAVVNIVKEKGLVTLKFFLSRTLIVL